MIEMFDKKKTIDKSPYYYGTQEELAAKIKTGFKLIKGCPWINQDPTRDAWLIHKDNCNILHVKGIKKHGKGKGLFYWTERIDKIYDNKNYNAGGYKLVSVGGKTVLLHRIMAMTWVPNPDPEHLTEVQHISTRGHFKRNNSADNLKWATRKDNMQKYFKSDAYHKEHKNYGKYFEKTQTYHTPDGQKIKMTFEEYLQFVKDNRGQVAYNRILKTHNKRMENKQK